MTDERGRTWPENVRPVFSLSEGAIPRSWLKAWIRFVDEHPQWWKKHETEGPLYALPPDVVHALAAAQRRAHKGAKPILLEEVAEDERAFYDLCREHGPHVIGVPGGFPIFYELPGGRLPFPTVDQLREAGLVGDEKATEFESRLHEAERKLDRVAHLRLGYVGKLLFDRDYQEFREERATLRENWRSLREQFRPPRPFASHGYPDRARLPAAFAALCLPL